MRLRLATSVASLIALLIAVTIASPAIGQIEFAHSTLRLASATEPVDADPAPTQKQTPVVRSSEFVFEESAPTAAVPQPNSPPENSTPANRTSPTATRGTSHPAPIVEPQATSRTRTLAGVHPTTSAGLNKIPHPMPVQAATMPTPTSPAAARLKGKPFQSVQSEPAISPYLNLYRNDAGQNQLLNYYTLVRPQLEQQEANKKQTAEMQKLRSQVQKGSQPSGVQQASATDASTEGMTVPAHYMDTAQFYKQRTHK